MKKWMIFSFLALFLSSCGFESQHSELSADKQWYGYCLDPSTAKWYNEGGQLVQRFACGSEWVSASAKTFGQAQPKAQSSCRKKFGSTFRLGNVGNGGSTPGVVGGDLSNDPSQPQIWADNNCHSVVR